ncbi:MAG: hypothetical protein PWP62_46 [Eubacteriaceae bacterium]|jgi:hypothetical protein|nr:hypothetical protein [Eubacteriaceae bacterium]
MQMEIDLLPDNPPPGSKYVQVGDARLNKNLEK